LLLVVVVLALCLIVPSLLQFLRIHWMASGLPGPRGLPIVGSIFELKEGSHVGLRWMMRESQKLREKGESIICFNIAGRIYTIPITARAAKVMVESHDITSKGRDYEFIKPWLGKGLLTASSEHWRNHRKIITPTFHFSRLNTYIGAFVEEAEVFVSIIKRQLEVEGDAYPLLKKCALDIICRTTFGYSFDMQNTPNHPYMMAVEGYNSYVQRYSSEIHMWFPPLWYLLHDRKVKELLEVLKEFTEEKIEERIRFRAEKACRGGNSFLDCLLNFHDSDLLSLQEVKDEVNTFVFAGHDTTSTTMAWLLWCLATNPDVQERLHRELDDVMEDCHEAMDVKLKNMPYLEMCIKETMRLYATAPFTERIAEADFDLDGYIIPAGSEIFLSPMLLHHNPDVYANDWEFDPSRFSPENVAARNHYDYLPFSGGPRNCIG
ncbi:hypothetical protein PENTCL1PPCAC_29982, partial [Pristionchus entomophagus]